MRNNLEKTCGLKCRLSLKSLPKEGPLKSPLLESSYPYPREQVPLNDENRQFYKVKDPFSRRSAFSAAIRFTLEEPGSLQILKNK
jgi:hypothetical protein